MYRNRCNYNAKDQWLSKVHVIHTSIPAMLEVRGPRGALLYRTLRPRRTPHVPLLTV